MKPFIELDKLRISYQDHGQGETIVLLHGFCCGSDSWSEIIPLLASNYRVIAPDLRGHAESSLPGDTCRMEEMAEDIRQLLDVLEIKKVTLFGHSMGGYISLAFAEKHADRLNGLSLIHSTAYADNELGKEARFNSIRTIEEQGLDYFLEGFIARFFAPDESPELREKFTQKARQIGQKTNPMGAIGCLKGMRERPDRNHVLSGLKVPVLLVAGNQDQIIPIARTFSVEGSPIKQVEMKGCGHSSMFEAPEQLVEIMVDFLSGC